MTEVTIEIESRETTKNFDLHAARESAERHKSTRNICLGTAPVAFAVMVGLGTYGAIRPAPATDRDTLRKTVATEIAAERARTNIQQTYDRDTVFASTLNKADPAIDRRTDSILTAEYNSWKTSKEANLPTSIIIATFFAAVFAGAGRFYHRQYKDELAKIPAPVPTPPS